MLNVKQLVAKRKAAEEKHQEFANKYGFKYKRAQHFRNCLVIRWKYRDDNDKVYKKLYEYGQVYESLGKTYNLFEPDDPFLDSEYVVLKVGIYAFWEFSRIWAIPNEFKEIQDFVLERLPKWAKVSRK